MQSTLPRNQGIDLTKALAIVGVVVIHVCSRSLSCVGLSFDWIAAVFLRSLVSASVPLFFMCSGALLLDDRKEISLRQLYTKRLPRIVVAMVIWATAYKGYHLLHDGTFSLPLLVQALKEVFLFRHEFHLYFIPIIIIVYIWLPIVRVFLKSAGRSDLRYLLAVWFVFGIAYPTLKAFWPFTLLDGIMRQWAINMTYAAIGYAVLGYYLSRYPLRRSLLVLSAAAGFAATFAGTVLLSLPADRLCTNLLEGMSINVALLAVGAFGLCCRENRLSGLRAVRSLSCGSFCIYLVHVFMIHFLKDLGVQAAAPSLVSVPVLSALIVLLSYGVYAVLKRIPLARRWLI